MTDKPRQLELLAPAKNIEIAREAILHGADAVYIGPPGFGARSSASNSLEELRSLVEFAHPYRARIYATVNTVVRDNELSSVEKMIRDLYRIGIDALIVQDMGLLRLDLPPVALHASTQCHIDSVEKALFLEEAGFSQLVLARELSEREITEIADAVSVPLEVFVHGALCVSYSGRCHASQNHCGRSANRGECAQLCRLPYTLTDATGKIIARDRHLLSLRDFNQLDSLESLINAGASSFKIEGRLKDAAYVKNIVSAYRQELDRIISTNPDKFCRSSAGTSEVSFSPDPKKSFNRGFTHYFYAGHAVGKTASVLTPKSLGEPIKDITQLNNGDGIAFFDRNKNYVGFNVNGIEGKRILNSKNIKVPENAVIYRTYDRKWDAMLNRPTADRKIAVDITLDETGVSATDERGLNVRVPLCFVPLKKENVSAKSDFASPFSKLGNTIYKLRNFSSRISTDLFVPASVLTTARRNLISALDHAANATYRYDYRRQENHAAVYPSRELTYKDNVTNELAARFYKDHGVVKIEESLESSGKKLPKGKAVMTTRYCILKELGMCKKEKKLPFKEPLFLNAPGIRYQVNCDCKRCGMELLTANQT